MAISLKFVVRSTLSLLGIGFIALLLVVLASIWLSQRAEMHLKEVDSARELLITATRIREALLASETSQRGYILTGNEIYLAPYDSAKSTALAELERLTRLLGERRERQDLLAQLSSTVAAKVSDLDRTISLRRAGREVESIAAIKTNRGKALMDELNIYLSAISLENDERLTSGVAEQTANTGWLRLASIASALVVMLVVSGVVVILQRYAREAWIARDEIKKINQTLEARVAERTAELARARDRAEVLLTEVNHRVANSLALVSSFVRLQAHEVADPSAKSALDEANTRVQAIAQMHRHLFTTGNVRQVAADTYLSSVLSQFETATTATRSTVTIKRDLAPVTLSATDAVNLGIVVTEWVTNSIKYAYEGRSGEIRVRLDEQGGEIHVSVEDDGVGRIEATPVQGTGFGTRIVNTIAGLMGAKATYRQRHPGMEARLSIPVRSTPLEATG